MRKSNQFAELSAQEKKSVNGGWGCYPEGPVISIGTDGNVKIQKPENPLKGITVQH